MFLLAAIFNLDDAIKKYAEKEAKVRKLKLEWVDCWHNNTYLKERVVMKPYQLRAIPGKFEIDEVKTETTQPEVVYKNTISNYGDSPMQSTIKESREREETKTITTTTGLEFNITGSSTATVKGVVGIGGGLSANFMLHKAETNRNSTKKTIEIQMEVTIPPRREVTVEWRVTNIIKNYSWTMDIYVTGYCVLYYDRTWNGNHVQTFPIKVLGYDRSTPEITLQSRRHSGIVKYKTRGVMTSVETLKHHVVVKEKRLSTSLKHRRKQGQNG